MRFRNIFKIKSFAPWFLLFCLGFHGINDGFASVKYATPDSLEQKKEELNFKLLLAADAGDQQEVLRLLNLGAEVNTRDADGVTLLMFASEQGHLNVVKTLVINGADINLKPKNGIGAFTSAVRARRFEIVEYLWEKGANVDEADNDLLTPLLHAIVFTDVPMTRLLLDLKAGLEKTDYLGYNALRLAATMNHKDIVSLLIEAGADVNSADPKGFTPLMLAVQHGLDTIVQILLENNASLDLQNASGFTALSFAVLNGNVEMASWLLNKKAKTDFEMSYGADLRSLALLSDNPDMLDWTNKHDFPISARPFFHKIQFGFDNYFFAEDYMAGFNLSLLEIKNNFDVGIGFVFRPIYTRVLEKKAENLYYQYWEQRNLINFDFRKNFILQRSYGTNFGMYASIQPYYTFASYRGLNVRPDNYFGLGAQAGLWYQFGFLNFYGGYSYLKFRDEYSKGSRFVTGLAIRFNTRKFNKKKPFYLYPVEYIKSTYDE